MVFVVILIQFKTKSGIWGNLTIFVEVKFHMYTK